MNKKKKILIGVVGIVLIAGLIFGVNYYINFKKYTEIIPQISINSIDLNTVNNGSYIGEFNAYIISSKVNVEVENHKITDISFIKHKYERGKPAEAVLPRVIEKQSLTVDTVSGATNSSKVILKSIEDALVQGQK